ncbi:hypothetical protein PsYK624_103180 [Phanerochaete sordida]|uniref:Heterokaryon incompatibility domain-containing protein n=1 Tax=Phanerochaete sordida TaxID=48140 RepID=A0A9P3LGB5_9APHY|nr:hypothetical protein PsYK624_103180 [Phanerochaete sordida]
MPCTDIPDALRHLNIVMGTKHTLEIESLHTFLKHAVAASRDFGELYGTVRPWWHYEQSDRFEAATTQLGTGEKQHSKATDKIVGGLYISDPCLPPRRIWDLYSNRVLPYFMLPEDKKIYRSVQLPDNLWTVSHSWTADVDRMAVWTNINGRQWPVSIPRKTTLDHVRVELLNMGAEYVWLDVLCLRQKGADKDEPTRIEEWKLDVPTIGHIYRGEPVKTRRCITYFNGLGLPLTTDPSVLASDRHWFNRAWTLQETLETWLPGGLTGMPLVNAHKLFAQLSRLYSSQTLASSNGDFSIDLLRDMKSRSCKNDLDKVSGIAYCFKLRKLPIYSEKISVEAAWERLLQALSFIPSTNLFLQYVPETPFGLFVSFSGFLEQIPVIPPIPAGITEQHIQQRHAHSHTQLAFAVSSCYISRKEADLPSGSLTITVRVGERSTRTFSLTGCKVHGIFLPNVSYTILFLASTGPGRHYCVLAELVGNWEYLWRYELCASAIKWGVIYAAGGNIEELAEMRQVRKKCQVGYLDEERAMQQSQYTDRYMQAFRKMREDGQPYIFGDAS